MKVGISVTLLSSVMLCSCGSGGSTAGTGTPPVTTPTPTPTPAVTPTPSPTPTASYTRFDDLVGDQRYAAACTGFTPGGVDVVIPTGITFYNLQGPISYAAAAQTYTVYAPNNVMQTFEPGTLVAGTPVGTKTYSKPSVVSSGTETFSLIRPAPGGIGLDYGRIATMNISGSPSSGTQARTSAFCVLGVPTRPSDVPPVASVSFTRFRVNGNAFDNSSGALVTYTLSKSTATLSVDLTTGIFTTTLHAIGTTAGGADTDFGTFSGSGSLGISDASLSGAFFSSPAGPLGGPLNGGFFGPQGSEFGYTFTLLRSTVGSPTHTDLALIGMVTGAR